MKKIIFLLLIGAVVGYFITSNNSLVLSKVQQLLPAQLQSGKSVEGASTSAIPKDFSLIQRELAKLPVSIIATSSPQIQTIIHLLQKMPKNQIKIVCQNVCSSIK